jgi:hypothetical protein
LADGFVTPSKTRLFSAIFTRNYQRGGKNVVIAIVTIPVVDVQTVIGIEVANVRNVRAYPKECFSVNINLTVA